MSSNPTLYKAAAQCWFDHGRAPQNPFAGRYAPQIYEEVIHRIDEQTNTLQKQKQLLLRMKNNKDMEEQKQTVLEDGHPYVYIQNVGHLFGSFDLCIKGFGILIYPVLPTIHSVWVLCAIAVIAVMLVRCVCCTYNPYAPRNMQISMTYLFAYLAGLLVNNMIYIMAVKDILENEYFVYGILIVTLMIFETYAAFQPFHFISKEAFPCEGDEAAE